MLSDRLISGITSQLTHVVRNGDPIHTYPGKIYINQLIQKVVLISRLSMWKVNPF